MSQPCSTCGSLGDYARGFQQGGREEQNTYLPPAVSSLTTICELKGQKLLRCPTCGSYFLYSDSYEYLATGSEEEQIVSRLGAGEGERLAAEAFAALTAPKK